MFEARTSPTVGQHTRTHGTRHVESVLHLQEEDGDFSDDLTARRMRTTFRRIQLCTVSDDDEHAGAVKPTAPPVASRLCSLGYPNSRLYKNLPQITYHNKIYARKTISCLNGISTVWHIPYNQVSY
jgi:hypothetical protein